jgi:hypothetical protein
MTDRSCRQVARSLHELVYKYVELAVRVYNLLKWQYVCDNRSQNMKICYSLSCCRSRKLQMSSLGLHSADKSSKSSDFQCQAFFFSFVSCSPTLSELRYARLHVRCSSSVVNKLEYTYKVYTLTRPSPTEGVHLIKSSSNNNNTGEGKVPVLN